MRKLIFRAAALYALACALAAVSSAQTPAPQPAQAAGPKLSGNIYGLDEMQRQLREQREEIDELRAAVKEQSRLIGELRSRVEHTEQLATRTADATQTAASVVRDAAYSAGAEATGANVSVDAAQDSKLEERVSKVEAQSKKTSEAVAKQIGSLTFGGDMRFRYESFYGQQNSLASAETPGALGNPLTTRQRLRMRARFSVQGKIGDEFDWGLRLTTGSYADMVSTNQTLTDFFNRKPFAVDQAYMNYRPKALQRKQGDFQQQVFQIQAGKFDTPWVRTEMTWDADISPEGLNESYKYNFGKSAFKNFGLVAWQLPLLERNSAFVLASDGSVDFGASGRAGRDLALYGAQGSTEVASKSLSLKLYASDLYFSGTQFVTPAQVFGANIQFPVTFTIPASGTSPARTITTQVSVPRDLLVSGNANLGLSLANTNAVNRDGRLSSGYNLVDLIARLDYKKSGKTHWPVMLLFDFVTNTQTHDVVTAGPTGADVLLPNREGQGYWAQARLGRDVLAGKPADLSRGDLMFDYVLTRVEKDAILSPFNGSDLGLSTDMRVQRFVFGYALDPRVAISFTGFFTQRPTGLLGAFNQTPPGSLNRTLTRLQFDTIFRF